MNPTSVDLQSDSINDLRTEVVDQVFAEFLSRSELTSEFAQKNENSV